MDFISILSIFVLAYVGYHVVWSVIPALHTPLMAEGVTAGTRPMPWRPILAVASALPLAFSASAQDKPRLSCYFAEFVLEPIQKSTGAVWIPEDDPIFNARLLPRELGEVEKAVTLDGSVLLRPGDQLMTMRSRTPIKCNFPQLRANAIAARERICVLDPDGDGVFDRIFSRSRGGDNWFAMAWEHPKEGIRTVPPISIRQIEPTQFKGGPSVRYQTNHIPLRRRPRDGSAPYYEAFTSVMMYGNDGLSWPMTLEVNSPNLGLVGGDAVFFKGLTIKIEEVAAEKTLVSYSGNFRPETVELPFRNSYERKCDTFAWRNF